MSTSIYLGIDVACALGKRLPICAVACGAPLKTISIPKQLADQIPRGLGNAEIRHATPFQKVAQEVARAIKEIEKQEGWRIERVAIDAPALAPSGWTRLSEDELQRLGLSSFRTPSTSEWAGIREKCTKYLELGGSKASLPYANKIWMKFGFELFKCVRSQLNVEVIEVYPFAIVRSLLQNCEHKSTERGYRDQLSAIASRTGWEPQNLEADLKRKVFGSRHDRLDAYMAAWVASLAANNRRAIGDASKPNDAIWVPL